MKGIFTKKCIGLPDVGFMKGPALCFLLEEGYVYDTEFVPLLQELVRSTAIELDPLYGHGMVPGYMR